MKKAFTLIEILIVVAIIGLITAIAVPSFFNYHQSAQDQVKEVNIESVNAAKDQWAILHNKAAGTSVTWTNIQDYVGNGNMTKSELDVGEDSITINEIGTSAAY